MIPLSPTNPLSSATIEVSTSNQPTASASDKHPTIHTNLAKEGGGGTYPVGIGVGGVQQVRTPSFDSTPTAQNTPIMSSSPDTPYINLQTPSAPIRHTEVISDLTQKAMDDTEESESAETEARQVGLGYGDIDIDLDLVNPPTSASVLVPFNTSDEEDQRRMQLGIGPSTSPGLRQSEIVVDDFPSEEELGIMEKRIKELQDARDSSISDGWEERDEFGEMVTKLLKPTIQQLPFLHSQIEAQRDTIRTLQYQAKLSESLFGVERERHAAERAGWQAETRALQQLREREIAAGIRPKKLLDLDVGYHQELEAANKRLEMDNRLMAPRLADTQRQIDKLVNELRHLRSQVVLSAEPLASSSRQPHTLEPRPPRARSPVKSVHATMGDARTEHLLLAAKKVRAMRASDDRVGRLTLQELQKGGVVGPEGGLGYSEGYGETIEEEDEGEEEDEEDSEFEDEKPYLEDRRGSLKGKGKSTPLLPRAKRSGKKSLPPPPTTPRGNKSSARPQTTPGGSNFNDLLRAAEMATRPGTPTPPSSGQKAVPLSAMSATRSTTRVREEDASERGSPVKRARRDGGWNADDLVGRIGFPSNSQQTSSATAGDEEDHEASALDLLAQASQLDVAQSQTTQDEPDVQGSAASNGEGALGPAIDLRTTDQAKSSIQDHQIDPALTSAPPPVPVAQTPKSRPRGLSAASEIHTPARTWNTTHPFPTPDMDPFEETPRGYSPPSSIARSEMISHELPPGAYASPTGATVPGLGKYVHLTSSMPAKRVRSPYLKWTVEEDELLSRAVALHGEKWDLVSKGVPTRSYHQVRQRWLRKTGAFDKKPQITESQQSGLEEEDDGSPTPIGGEKTPGGGIKKRKLSQA